MKPITKLPSMWKEAVPGGGRRGGGRGKPAAPRGGRVRHRGQPEVEGTSGDLGAQDASPYRRFAPGCGGSSFRCVKSDPELAAGALRPFPGEAVSRGRLGSAALLHLRCRRWCVAGACAWRHHRRRPALSGRLQRELEALFDEVCRLEWLAERRRRQGRQAGSRATRGAEPGRHPGLPPGGAEWSPGVCQAEA